MELKLRIFNEELVVLKKVAVRNKPSGVKKKYHKRSKDSLKRDYTRRRVQKGGVRPRIAIAKYRSAGLSSRKKKWGRKGS